MKRKSLVLTLVTLLLVIMVPVTSAAQTASSCFDINVYGTALSGNQCLNSQQIFNNVLESYKADLGGLCSNISINEGKFGSLSDLIHKLTESIQNNNDTQQPAEPETPSNPDEGSTAEPAEPAVPDETDSSTGNTAYQYADEILALVNTERAAAGLNPLSLNEDLCSAAVIKSKDMADKNYFSHTSPTFGSSFNLLKSLGINYSYAGENIAKGYGTPEAVMNGWMNSSGHRANILNASFTQLGVGYYVGANNQPYWTQLFIRP